jgi:hypothetical protein
MAAAFFFASSIMAGSVPDQRTRHLPERLAKGQTELDAGYGSDQDFVDVLDRLDEVRLAQDEVRVVRLVDLDCVELHGRSFLPSGPRSRFQEIRCE